MKQISPKNNLQDIKIARIDERLEALEKRFNDFIDNEFSHLRDNVDKIIWGGIIGFLITITTILISKFL